MEVQLNDKETYIVEPKKALNFAGEDNLDKNNIYHIISNPISFILLIILIFKYFL